MPEENLQKENKQLKEYLESYEALIFNLKEQLERSEKARKEAVSIIKSKQEIIALSVLGYDVVKLINILEKEG